MIKFESIPPNVDGNPRVVCHFLNLNTPKEKSHEFAQEHGLGFVLVMRDIALNRARKIGGKRYHNKRYGGGIAFTISARSIEELEDQIIKLVAEATEQENK